MISTRRESILQLIIEDYIETAQPVGSKQLIDRHKLDVSSATIRHEMAELEQEGYLHQPHISAGRVPTERAYLYYLQHVVEPKKERIETEDFMSSRSETGSQILPEIQSWTLQDDEIILKMYAKRLAELSGETVVVATESHARYYIGVSNLFQKPDFEDLELLRSLSTFFDQFDEVMARIYEDVEDEPVVYIGSSNPFGDAMSTILIHYELRRLQGLLGLVGPLRMNYGRNVALLERARELMRVA